MQIKIFLASTISQFLKPLQLFKVFITAAPHFSDVGIYWLSFFIQFEILWALGMRSDFWLNMEIVGIMKFLILIQTGVNTLLLLPGHGIVQVPPSASIDCHRGCGYYCYCEGIYDFWLPTNTSLITLCLWGIEVLHFCIHLSASNTTEWCVLVIIECCRFWVSNKHPFLISFVRKDKVISLFIGELECPLGLHWTIGLPHLTPGGN